MPLTRVHADGDAGTVSYKFVYAGLSALLRHMRVRRVGVLDVKKLEYEYVVDGVTTTGSKNHLASPEVYDETVTLREREKEAAPAFVMYSKTAWRVPHRF